MERVKLLFIVPSRPVLPYFYILKKNLDFYEYTPLQVKQSVVGYGRAEKRQVMEMVKMFLHLEKVPKLDDTADALALAICHAHASESKIQGFYNLKKEKLL